MCEAATGSCVLGPAGAPRRRTATHPIFELGTQRPESKPDEFHKVNPLLADAVCAIVNTSCALRGSRSSAGLKKRVRETRAPRGPAAQPPKLGASLDVPLFGLGLSVLAEQRAPLAAPALHLPLGTARVKANVRLVCAHEGQQQQTADE